MYSLFYSILCQQIPLNVKHWAISCAAAVQKIKQAKKKPLNSNLAFNGGSKQLPGHEEVPAQCQSD